MNQSPDPQAVVIRPARPADRDEVLAFCARVWDGDDYIPYIWDQWIADPKGQMFVAELAGRAVGLARLTWLAPGQWWLEGLRIDPDLHDRHLGSLMNDFINRHWDETGDGVVRLQTTSTRPKVHHMCERGGFSRVLELTVYTAPALDEPVPDLVPVAAGQIEAAIAVARSSPSLALTLGLQDVGWKYVPPDAAHLLPIIEKGWAFWWRGDRGLLALWDDEDKGDRYLLVGVLACALEDIPALLMDYRRMAQVLGFESATWFAPMRDDLLLLLEQAGFMRDWDQSAYVYERWHPTRP